jgi:hypothetical protein
LKRECDIQRELALQKTSSLLALKLDIVNTAVVAAKIKRLNTHTEAENDLPRWAILPRRPYTVKALHGRDVWIIPSRCRITNVRLIIITRAAS